MAPDPMLSAKSRFEYQGLMLQALEGVTGAAEVAVDLLQEHGRVTDVLEDLRAVEQAAQNYQRFEEVLEMTLEGYLRKPRSTRWAWADDLGVTPREIISVLRETFREFAYATDIYMVTVAARGAQPYMDSSRRWSVPPSMHVSAGLLFPSVASSMLPPVTATMEVERRRGVIGTGGSAVLPVRRYASVIFSGPSPHLPGWTLDIENTRYWKEW